MGCNQSAGSKGAAQEGATTQEKTSQSANPGDKDQTKKRDKDNNEGFKEKLNFLKKVQLFTRLPQDQVPILASSLEAKEFQPGQVVIKQGDTGAEFFLIKSGDAKVQVMQDGSNTEVAKLKKGDYFGENALVRDEPRNATIVAVTHLVTFTISRQKFRELGLNEKLQFANRKAVGGGGARTLVTKPPSPKNDQERQLIVDALKKNENMRTMVSLDQARLNSLVDIAWKENVKKDTAIITEGDLVADYFYIVQEGSFEIYVSDQDATGEDGPQSAEKVVTGGESKYVSTVSKGGSFGELALLYLVPRAATVQAKEDSVVWVIDRKKFKDILMKVSDEKIDEYCAYLNKVKILAPLLADEKHAIAQALIEMHFVKNEVILQQGEAGNTFYILYEGEVIVTKNKQETARLSAGKGADPQIFGERALLSNEPRVATISVSTQSAKALALSREDFDMLLGPLQEIIARDEGKGPKRESMCNKGRASKMQAAPPKQDGNRTRIFRKDLKAVGLLGCGGFGAVELYEHKTSGETYAMKSLSKGYIVKTGMQESVMNEKNILLMTNSDFIIKLFEAYNGTQTLYFLMEPALGGELYATYNRKGFHGSEKHARFYVAGVVFAFEHVHERKIIYRDLKPENLLLTETGRLKLTDMGLAKFVIGKTYTTCGTPDYFAPELITSQGHTQAVDWWTLGVLIFELMSGHPPFESPYPMQIYQKVMRGIAKCHFPPKCGGPVGDLIKALLRPTPSERLPVRPGGVQNLKDHKWYSDFDWKASAAGTLEAPYKPAVKSRKDIANFSARKEDMPRTLEYKDDGSGWDKDFATF